MQQKISEFSCLFSTTNPLFGENLTQWLLGNVIAQAANDIRLGSACQYSPTEKGIECADKCRKVTVICFLQDIFKLV
jgi:hypothetical protein